MSLQITLWMPLLSSLPVICVTAQFIANFSSFFCYIVLFLSAGKLGCELSSDDSGPQYLLKVAELLVWRRVGRLKEKGGQSHSLPQLHSGWSCGGLSESQEL